MDPIASNQTPVKRDAARWGRAGAWVTVSMLLLWAGAVGLSLLVSLRTGEDVPTCLFRRVTGLPCATCGGTRVVYALSRGQVQTALELNPLVAVMVVAGPLVVAWFAWRSRRQRSGGHAQTWMSARAQSLWLGVFLVLLGLNWVFVARPGSLARRPMSGLAERWQERNAGRGEGLKEAGGRRAPQDVEDVGSGE